MNSDEKKLLISLIALAKKGPIPAIGTGSNTVGKTLQQHLGIKHSTKSRNKLHGYTVTATTSKKSSSGRTNLFACVPDWESSNIKSSKEMVETFGRENIKKDYSNSLFCTTSSLGANSFGLYLKVDLSNKTVQEWHSLSSEEKMAVNWQSKILENKLNDLNKVAIITALPVNTKSSKAFHYRSVDLLEEPSYDVFLDMIGNGTINIDHCISIKNGQKAAREQGPLFKIRVDAKDELYNNYKRYDLMDLSLDL